MDSWGSAPQRTNAVGPERPYATARERHATRLTGCATRPPRLELLGSRHRPCGRPGGSVGSGLCGGMGDRAGNGASGSLDVTGPRSRSARRVAGAPGAGVAGRPRHQPTPEDSQRVAWIECGVPRFDGQIRVSAQTGELHCKRLTRRTTYAPPRPRGTRAGTQRPSIPT